jgi:RNA polymerase sigma factor (sigma-70 family)
MKVHIATRSSKLCREAFVHTDTERKIKEWMPVVRSMVWRRLRKLSVGVQFDDLYQAGLIGLWQAIERHDGKTSLRPFACSYINHCISGELRRWDYLKSRTREAAQRGQFDLITFVEFDEARDAREDDETPYSIVEFNERIEQCVKYLPLLPARWQQVITMRYIDEMEWHDIGTAFGRTASWAHQMGNTSMRTLHRWIEFGYAPLPRQARCSKSKEQTS